MKSILVIATLTLVFASALSMHSYICTANAVTPRIYLSPSNITFYGNETNVGDKFNVTAMVENAPDIGAWQVYIEFNETLINVTRWFEPSTDLQYIFHGKTTTPNPTPPNPGYVHLGAVGSGRARLQVASNLFPTPPGQPPSSGSGKLCILEFVILSIPAPDVTLIGGMKINTATTTILNPDGDDVTPLTKEDGTYTIVYVVPEFSYSTGLPLIMAAMLTVVALRKKIVQRSQRK